MPRLLLVTQQLPWPRDSGGNQRTGALLEALAGSFEVVLCSTSDGSPAAREGEARFRGLGVDVRLVPDTKRRGAAGQAVGVLGALLRGESAVVAHNRNPRLGEAVRGALAEGVDLVHLNHIDTAPYLDLEDAPPTVLDTHNLLFEYYARRAEVEDGLARRWVCRREARLLREREPALFRRVSRVLVCSQTERRTLLGLAPDLAVEVVPNGVDCEALRPGPFEATLDSADLVFVGDLGYGPNADAVLWFAEEVLPRVRAEEPAARLVAVGKNPPAPVVSLGEAREDVVVTGFVAEVAPFVRGARLCVVPIRYGSGTRLKVLEAFAFGKPTVATTVGAEGIEARDGEELLLRDGAEDTARAVVELLRDPARARRLGERARALAEERYDWRRIGARLVELHRSLLGG
jgi:glycosyltransferase involved in cell wall biosynthesis